MRLKIALIAATALSPLALPAVATAQPVTGLYIGAGVGYNFQQGTRLNANGRFFDQTLNARGLGTPASTGGKATFDNGGVGVLSLGWGFGNGIRVEVEGNYRENDPSKIRGFLPGGAPFAGVGGTQRTYGVMGNVFYDLDFFYNFGLPSYIQPYIGGGVGVAWNQWQQVPALANNGTRLDIYRDQARFAYQGIAGFAIPIEAVPGLAITAEYRFLGTTPNPLIADFRGTGSLSSPVLAQGRLTSRDYNHSGMVGLRYAFGVAPPPPPPVAVAPAPPPARTYLVFFDWDRADLTDRARQIIAEAANASRTQQVTRLEVNGYTDRSGTVPYNQRLSIRRAESVAAQLVRDGVPRGAIFIQGFGETRNLVPTADGVREPQNRRVEIILR